MLEEEREREEWKKGDRERESREVGEDNEKGREMWLVSSDFTEIF